MFAIVTILQMVKHLSLWLIFVIYKVVEYEFIFKN